MIPYSLICQSKETAYPTNGRRKIPAPREDEVRTAKRKSLC